MPKGRKFLDSSVETYMAQQKKEEVNYIFLKNGNKFNISFYPFVPCICLKFEQQDQVHYL